MFFSVELLRRKGPLGVIWAIANGARVPRGSILGVNIGNACEEVIDPEVPHSLRLKSLLVGGIVVIFQKQLGYLLDDALNLLRKIRAPVNEDIHTTLEPMDAVRGEPRMAALTCNPDDFQLSELISSMELTMRENTNSIELLPPDFDIGRAENNDHPSPAVNVLDESGSPDRSSRHHEYEDQAPSQAGQLPDCLEFFDDGDCDDYNNSSVSVQHLKLRTKDGSFGNVSFPSPNKISSNEADQIPNPHRRKAKRKRVLPKVDCRMVISSREYKRWMEQTSPTCTTRPRKRQCFQKYFGPDASITPLIMESGRPWCNKLKKQYTKFVRADPSAPPAEAGVDDMDIDGEPNPNIASLRSSSELDVHMDFPDWDGIDVNPTFDNQENETPQMVGSGWTPLQHGLQGSQGRRTPTLTPDVARYKEALTSGQRTASGILPVDSLPGSNPHSNPHQVISWHSSQGRSSRTSSDGSHRMPLMPRNPGQLTTVQECSIQDEPIKESQFSLQIDTGYSTQPVPGSVDNSTLAVMQIVQENFRKQELQGVSSPQLSFIRQSQGLVKMEAAKLFYQMLVSHANGLVELCQEAPYEDIIVQPPRPL